MSQVKKLARRQTMEHAQLTAPSPPAEPALPFAPELGAARAWLDHLAASNIGECCAQFYAAIRASNLNSLDPALRFDILEAGQKTLSRLTHDLRLVYFGKSLPLDGKSRKLARLPMRLHFEFALGYLAIAATADSASAVPANQLPKLLSRAFDHLAHCLFLSAQVYEPPPKRFWEIVAAVARRAGRSPLSQSQTAVERLDTLLMFQLSAPMRLEQSLMARWYVALGDAQSSSPSEPNLGFGFVYQTGDSPSLWPSATAALPADDRHWVPAEPRLRRVRPALRQNGAASDPAIAAALARLGERLPVLDRPATRSAHLSIGLKAIEADLKKVGLRKLTDDRSVNWSVQHSLELLPPEHGGPTAPTRFTALASPASQSVTIEVTDLPGFYLLDLGQKSCPGGQLVGLNADDQWLQIGVIRGGQIQRGGFWHSFELLGTAPERVKAQVNDANGLPIDGFVTTNAPGRSGLQLLVQRADWINGQRLILTRANRPEHWQVAQLLETTAHFQSYWVTLVPATP